MTFKEYLISKGLTDEQANTVVDGMPANKLYISSEENLDIRYSKLKADLEQAKGDLAAANKLVGDLKKDNANVEALQTKVIAYEAQVAKLEIERATERKSYAIKEALTKAGATDIDYLMFKLGDVELDKDGNIKDLDNKVKSLKETTPTFFKADDPKDPPPSKGFKPIDTKLPNGNVTQLDVSKMTTDEINANWDAISAQNKK